MRVNHSNYSGKKYTVQDCILARVQYEQALETDDTDPEFPQSRHQIFDVQVRKLVTTS